MNKYKSLHRKSSNFRNFKFSFTKQKKNSTSKQLNIPLKSTQAIHKR